MSRRLIDHGSDVVATTNPTSGDTNGYTASDSLGAADQGLSKAQDDSVADLRDEDETVSDDAAL
ncbi:hypothetical protein MMC30_004943 [Trapelia coarctata]|nr:hypothetical protein [Trapelia coarctata]